MIRICSEFSNGVGWRLFESLVEVELSTRAIM